MMSTRAPTSSPATVVARAGLGAKIVAPAGLGLLKA
jgi:hypothetical protein